MKQNNFQIFFAITGFCKVFAIMNLLTLGGRRIPLSAYSYHVIRTTFPEGNLHTLYLKLKIPNDKQLTGERSFPPAELSTDDANFRQSR